MRHFAKGCMLTLTSLVAFIFCGICAEGANIVKNPGFEQDISAAVPASWLISGGQNIFLDNSQHHNGLYSVRIDGDGRDQYFTCGWYKIPPCKPGESYKLSAWVKTASADENSAFINMAQCDKDGKWLGGWIKVDGNVKLLSNGGTHDWAQYEITIPAEVILPEAVKFNLYLRSNSKKGSVWYDDISFTVAGQAANLLNNPGFERCTYPMPGWSCQDWSKSTCGVYSNDTSVKHSGKQSMKITGGDGPAWLSQEVVLKPNTEYVLSGWFKGDKVDGIGGKGHGAFAILYRGRNYENPVATLGWYKGTFDWTNKTGAANQEFVTFRTGNETVYYIRLANYNGGVGSTAWFDDISIQEKSESGISQIFPLRAVIPPVDWQPGRTLNMLDNTPNIIPFWYTGDRQQISDPKLVVELPKDIKFLGGKCLIPKKGGYALSSCLTEAAGEFTRYIFSITPQLGRLSWNALGWQNADYLYVRPVGYAGKEFNVRWRLSCGGRESMWSSFKVNVLPEMPNEQINTKWFRLGTFTIPAWAFPDAGLRKEFLGLYAKAGISSQWVNGFYGYPDDVWDGEAKLGWETTFMSGWNGECTWKKDLEAAYGEGWEEQISKEDGPIWVVDRNGKADNTIFCPGYLLAKGKAFLPFYEKLVSSQFNASKNFSVYIHDWEPPHYTPNRGCFCARCIKNFAQKNGIPTEGLTAAKIISEYNNRWIIFCQEQVAKIVDFNSRLAKRLKPGIKVYICSGYLNDYKKQVDGKAMPYQWATNLEMLDGMQSVDGHAPMIYISGWLFFDAVDAACSFLKKPVYPLVAVNERFANTFTKYSPERSRQCILASAACGAGGTYMWAYPPEDGLYLQKIRQAMCEVAELEDFFKSGVANTQTVSISTLPENKGKSGGLRYKVHQSKSGYLLSIFNYDEEKDCYIKISCPKLENGNYAIYNPVKKVAVEHGGRKIWNALELARGLVYLVPKQETVFLVIGKAAASPAYKAGISAETILSGYNRAYPVKPARKTVKEGSLLSKWEDFDCDGVDELLLSNGTENVWINPYHGAQIWGWRSSRDSSKLVKETFRSGPFGGGACFDLFWYPSKAIWSGEERAEYSLISQTVKDGRVQAEFERKLRQVDLDGLVINKTYSLPSEGSRVDVEYQFKNTGSRQIEFGFWSHNLFEVAPASVITIPTATGRLSLKPTQDNYVYNVPGEDESFLKPHRAGELAEGWFSVNRESGQADIRVGIDYNKLLQLYFYNGTPNTFEWMYKKVKLNPGDKWSTGFSLTYN
jgi:hypothetical protein